MEMRIDFNFLGRFVLQANQTTLHFAAEVQADAVGVAQNLLHLLIETKHQPAFAAPRALSDVLTPHHAFADTGDSCQHRRAADEKTPIHDLVHAWDSGRDARGWIVGRGTIPTRRPRRLDAAIDLKAAAIT